MPLDEFIRRSKEIHKDENGNPKYLYHLIKEYKNINSILKNNINIEKGVN